MATYVPIGDKERAEMLASVGVDSKKLFDHIPKDLRFDPAKVKNIQKEEASEAEVLDFFTELSKRNHTVEEYDSYLGAGYYDHYIPSAVHHLLDRQEFLTSYTPYQQEISQGTLQATYEWQSYICRLTGMEIANSSMYDGATAVAEAALMSFRVRNKAQKVWLSAGLNPMYLEAVETYLTAQGLKFEVGQLDKKGHSQAAYPAEAGYSAFIVQSPNFYGVVEDLGALSEKAHAVDALAIAVCDPMALVLFKTPGELGVDIVVGEAQSLGGGLHYGGPSLGYMATRQKIVHKMPGRICGATVDRDGNRAFVLTLQAREQHIRRERATSNICTAQALLATGATIYMALMGEEGMREAASQSADKARYLHQQLIATGLFEEVYKAPFFREFVVRARKGLDLEKLNKQLLKKGIIGGVVLDKDSWLLAVTEKKSKAKLDHFVETVQALAGKEA